MSEYLYLNDINTEEMAIDYLLCEIHTNPKCKLVIEDNDICLHTQIQKFIYKILNEIKTSIGEVIVDEDKWWEENEDRNYIENKKTIFYIFYGLLSSKNIRKILRLCHEEGLIK